MTVLELNDKYLAIIRSGNDVIVTAETLCRRLRKEAHISSEVDILLENTILCIKRHNTLVDRVSGLDE